MCIHVYIYIYILEREMYTLMAPHEKTKGSNTAVLPRSHAGRNQLELSGVQSEMRSMLRGLNKEARTDANLRRP